MQTLATIGECALIERIRTIVASASRAHPATDAVRLGIGDDCAVIRPPDKDGWDLLMTSDAVIEAVHFDATADAAAIGHKAIGRCLSDIAAMGGEPQWALVNLVAPSDLPVARIEALMSGLVCTAATHATAVVGGDVAAGRVLEAHVFLVGRVPAGGALRRDGARAGDALYVTGRLGGSIRGRHLTFEPRIREGQWLRAGGWATAMIDVSDGLGLDVRRLATASGLAVRIDPERVPVTEAARRMHDGRSGLAHALGDGEDYELLFCVNSGKKVAFERDWQRAGLSACTWIGEMLAGQAGGLELVGAGGRHAPLPQGYEHFTAGTTSYPFA